MIQNAAVRYNQKLGSIFDLTHSPIPRPAREIKNSNSFLIYFTTKTKQKIEYVDLWI